MATGGLRKAVCKLTATSVPNQISISSLLMPKLSFSTTGKKIGRNTSMIAGHSNGQPSTKISTMINASFQMSGSGRPTKVLVMTFAVPSLVKTAPNTFDPTTSNSTMLEVTIVETAAVLSAAHVS